MVIAALCMEWKSGGCRLIRPPGSRYYCACGGLFINKAWRTVYIPAESFTPQPIVQRCCSKHDLGGLVGIEHEWGVEDPPPFCQNPKCIFRNASTCAQPNANMI